MEGEESVIVFAMCHMIKKKLIKEEIETKRVQYAETTGKFEKQNLPQVSE